MPCFFVAYRLPYRISQAQVRSAFLCFLLPGMVRTPTHMLSTLPKHAAALTIKRWRCNDYKLWVMQSYATPNMLYMVTFTINIPPMLVHIQYMDPMGKDDS